MRIKKRNFASAGDNQFCKAKRLQVLKGIITMEKKRIEMNMAKPEVNKNVLKFKGGKKKTR